ncbi:MAG: 2,4'-dihydroxyacetophenone dioxygenase family protein [Acidimicrobiales bacterium]|jgi:2,4'-dihydroxyacetophenone dioxygenase|nr:2,4'-dihydroxyacetophenone dioxygenase family protein [Acidimicrobiales bacterium]HMS89785.1 2,4'-dihydroxyacetophenone dioxygenase family protein [Acidimicrobiales bacterium]
MSTPPVPLAAVPAALHRGEDELPFVEFGPGQELQLLQVDLDAGFWVIRNRFQPGTMVQTHRHTGAVFAFTVSGSWKYAEYPEVNTAGSYLFEPAGSQHTLVVPDTNTEVTDVRFLIHGANLNLDAEGRVELVIDAALVLDFYRSMCEALGHPDPPVIGA